MLFGLVFLSYVTELLIDRKKIESTTLTSFATRSFTRVLLALLGFLVLLTVGALGGALVHGPSADPMIRFITGFLGLQ